MSKRNWSILWFRKWKVFSILLSLWIFVSACGYRFAGDGDFPPWVRSLCVTVFENRTGEIGMETVFANDLIDEFTRNSSLVLAARADAILSGRIESLSIETVSRRGSDAAAERQAEIKASMKLTGADGKVLWSAEDISGREAYLVTSDKLATEHNRREAISTISKRIAERVYHRLRNHFRE
ncbi:MAG: hypothetical protein DRI57_26385 [Deltaproteobacteria bacterium]|nr:MAG: hypothetical protein DRI57_26385 [Deltaproteobacteria bacterium]